MDIHPSAWIASSASIDRTWPRGVHIAENCLIDDGAIVLTHDGSRGLYLDTRIGARTIVGARAILMPGISIGVDCRIEPGSVVTTDLAPGSHVGGNPARPLRR